MKSYFLTQDIMGNTIKNALKAGAIIAGLATNPILADNTTNSKVATIVANGENIDSNSKLIIINSKISQIQAKIKLIEQKNELSDKDYDILDNLDTKLNKLNAEKLAIIDSANQQKINDKTISIEKNQNSHKNLEYERYKNTKKIDEIKNLLAKK